MGESEFRFSKGWRSDVWDIALFSNPGVQYDSLKMSFGEPDPESDQYTNPPGPVKYWPLEYPCGLKIILEWHSDPGILNIYANRFEHAHVQRHLHHAVPFDGAWSSLDQKDRLVALAKSQGMPPLAYFAADKPWKVERLDDNANIFIVEDNLTERSAKCIAALLEATGHKQSYTAKQKQETA